MHTLFSELTVHNLSRPHSLTSFPSPNLPLLCSFFLSSNLLATLIPFWPTSSLSSCFLLFSFRLICAYLSCKVDEFNVSSTQFVGNLVQESAAGQERALEQILEYELLLIQQLTFHLVVHTPYRPMEGLLIDIKVGKMEMEILTWSMMRSRDTADEHKPGGVLCNCMLLRLKEPCCGLG